MDYRPENPPQNPAELPAYLVREFARMQQVLNSAQDLMWLNKRNVAPPKLRDGLIAYADGTNWNPGSGEGPYMYYGGAWRFLG